MGNLFEELKRRNVFRVGVAYAIVGWIAVQVVGEVADPLGLPEWTAPLVIVLMGIGFPIALILAWAFELTPEGVKKTKDVKVDASVTPSTGRKLDFVIIGALVLGLGYFVWDKFGDVPGDEGGPDVWEASDKGIVASIAVLPFVNMSSDPEQEYFSDGLAEEILNVLARVEGLAVASRTSAFAYKGENKNIGQIASELRVTHVLEGSVRKAGNRVRITAQLIDAVADRHLWSNTYDRELADIFAIQDEIATSIGRALRTRLVDARGNTLSIKSTENVAAHNAYLQGRYFLHPRGDDNVARAVELFEEAIALDPEFAAAHASLAIAKTIGWGQLDPRGAADAAERALELNPALPEAWLAAGKVASRQFQFEEAERMYREAIALEPRNAAFPHHLATLLSVLDRHAEAVPLAERAVSLDPTAAIYRMWLGKHLMALGRTDEGMAHLDAVMAISGAGYYYAVSWKAVRGDTAGALETLEAVTIERDLGEDDAVHIRAFILVAAGRIEEARALLAGREIREGPGAGGHVPIVYAYLGNMGAANRAMESLIANGAPLRDITDLIRFMPGHPMGKTRYNELRAAIGLPGLDEE